MVSDDNSLHRELGSINENLRGLRETLDIRLSHLDKKIDGNNQATQKDIDNLKEEGESLDYRLRKIEVVTSRHKWLIGGFTAVLVAVVAAFIRERLGL